MAKKQDDIAFVATYEDGSTEIFAIDMFTLRSGDHVAMHVAYEWQSGGRLPAGKIVSAKRLQELTSVTG